LQKSEAILASFLAMIPPSCRVLREGTLQNIPAADLVKGDVVLVVCTISYLYLTHIAYTSGHILTAYRRQDASRSAHLCRNGSQS
jgi:hypothetical protein